MFYKIWLIVIILLPSLLLGQAKPQLKKSFNTTDGIKIPEISAITNDNDGFLWIAGLTNDIHSLNNQNNIPVLQRVYQNSIHTIPFPENVDNGKRVAFHKRQDGQFYITTTITEKANSIFLFDPISSRFSAPITPGKSSENYFISAMVSFEDKELFLIQNDKEITVFTLKEDLTEKAIFSFRGGDNIYAVGENTVIIPWKDYVLISNPNLPIMLFDWEGNKIKTFEKSAFKYPADSKSKHPWIDEYFVQNNNYYFFLNRNPQLYQFNKTNLDLQPVAEVMLKTTNYEIVTDEFGQSLIVSNEGAKLSFYQFKKDEIIKTYSSIPYNGEKINQAYSSNLKSGIWLSVVNSELQYIRFPTTKIKTFLTTASVRSFIHLTDETYLVITDNSDWFRLNLENLSVTPFLLKKGGNKSELHWAANPVRIGVKLWVCHNGTMKSVNIEDGEIAEYTRHYPALCMQKKNDSILIFGTGNYRIMQYNIYKDTYTALIETDSMSVLDLEVTTNELIAATEKGLLVYNFNTKEHELFQQDQKLEDAFIVSLTKHPTYHYLLGTKTGYLIAFNPRTKQFQTLYKDERGSAIATALQGEDETLWLNTFNGIVKFNTKTKESQRFSTADGLSHNEGNRMAALKTKNGMLFGSLKGMNYFEPKDLKVDIDNSQLVLLSILKYEVDSNAIVRSFNRNEFKANQPIELEAENRTLSLEFGLKNSNPTADYRYKYQLNNAPWVALKKEPSIRFANLEPGDYILKIKALNFANEQQGDVLTLTILSKNFFYKTGWFYLLLGFITVSILLGFLWQQRKRGKIQAQFSRDLITTQEKERNRIAKELHDSIGQQLSLIKRKSQNENQRDISELAGNTLEEVRNISRNLYPALLKEIGLTESIRELVNQYDEETELFFTIDLINIDHYYNQEEALNIYRFTQEALNNSIKYAQARAITIQILKSNKNTIELSIEDNGVGFDLEQKQRENTLGLKTLRERISILKGTFEIRSTAGKGTFICASIPTLNE